MDHQAFAQLLGNYGEFVGAFAVVGTLVYLAIQVRHGKIATEANTRAIEESRKLALAQSFQARTQLVDASMVEIANSGELAPIMYKGLAGDFESLTEDQLARMRIYGFALLNRFDNMLYQYQQGFLEQDFYEASFKSGVKAIAPLWEHFDQLRVVRKGLRDAIEEIVRE